MPFHHPQAAIRNTGVRTDFDALIADRRLQDPALAIRGAETQDRALTPWSTGLRAIGMGLRALHDDDETFVREMERVLDGLYRFCQDLVAPVGQPATGSA